MASNDVDCCPHCQNRIGFVFGTCTACGWNYLDDTFHFITVWLADAPVPNYLIMLHAERTRKHPNPLTTE